MKDGSFAPEYALSSYSISLILFKLIVYPVFFFFTLVTSGNAHRRFLSCLSQVHYIYFGTKFYSILFRK